MYKAQRLLLEIEKLEVELKKHQDKCKHPDKHLFYQLCGSTGHYDLSDSYWTNYYCRLCQKRWTQSGQDNLRGTEIKS